jgi:hypothetical protein
MQISRNRVIGLITLPLLMMCYYVLILIPRLRNIEHNNNNSGDDARYFGDMLSEMNSEMVTSRVLLLMWFNFMILPF